MEAECCYPLYSLSSVQRCGLEIINIMNNDATLNAAAGAYEGLDRFDARKQLWQDMKVRPCGHAAALVQLPSLPMAVVPAQNTVDSSESGMHRRW